MAASMSLINISGNVEVVDPNYRYRMPRIVGKVEGRGNGIKTVLFNITELAQSLNRDPQEVTKFFGCDMGSQTTYDDKTDRAIVNGAHRDSDLQIGVHKYIEGFVLCKGCRLPETRYKIKDGAITQRCAACGAKTNVDMSHKLTAFILAQHKKAKESGADKLSKEDRRKAKDAAKAAIAAGEEPPSSKDKKDKGGSSSPGPEEKEKRSKKSSKSSSSSSSDNLAENVFGAATAAAAAAEEEEIESDSKAAEDASERFVLWVMKQQQANGAPVANATDAVAAAAAATAAATATIEVDPKAQIDQLRALQTLASLPASCRVIIFLGAVCPEPTVAATVAAIKRSVPVLRLMAPATSEIQQRQMIAAFEWLCGTKHPSLIKTFPIVCKTLLDEEVVEEDTFLMWSTDYARNDYSAEQSMIDIDTLEKLKEAAQPFIKWLEEAEEDGSGDDEDDEEEEEEDA